MHVTKVIIIGFIIVIVVGTAYVFSSKFATPNNKTEQPAPNEKATSTKTNVAAPIVVDTKKFTFKPVGAVKIEGSGTLSLQETVTSVGARLTMAPNLVPGENYELYIVSAKGEPELVSAFIFVNSKTEKYALGGAGTKEWINAKKIIVTKRKTTQTAPGVTVAEAVFESTK